MYFFLSLLVAVSGEMLNLTPENIEDTLKNKQLVMINFSANWCRYSQALKPVYQKAADEITHSNVCLAYADCVQHGEICARYGVNKYPTMKFVRDGQMMKSEYRGQRSVEAISQHINDLMKDPVTQIHGQAELDNLKEEEKAKFVIGYFASTSNYAYQRLQQRQ